MLIEHMAQGRSYESFSAKVDSHRATLYRWEAEFPEFCDAKKRAFEKCQLWWEEKGIEGLWNTKEISLNTGAWVFNMKNRFKWTDRVEVEPSKEGVFKVAYQNYKDKEPPKGL